MKMAFPQFALSRFVRSSFSLILKCTTRVENKQTEA